jgi:hypothetical protein
MPGADPRGEEAPKSATMNSPKRGLASSINFPVFARAFMLVLLTSTATGQVRGRGITPVFDLDGELLGTTADLQSAFGGTYASAQAEPTISVQFSPGPLRVHVTIPNTGTPWAEEFLALIPAGPMALGSSPLLVLFHGAGQRPTDPVPAISVEDAASVMISDALSRGWHVLIPLGGHAYNFGHADAQTNTELSLEVFMSMFGSSIDPGRVYGYGHSMGGGWLLAQAGLRCGVDHLRFAALFANGGTPSNSFTYETALNHGALDIIFGASPSTDPFAYSRSSAADISSTFPFPTDPTNAPVTNLATTPIRSETCWWDRLQYKTAAHSLHDFLDTKPALNHLSVPDCALPFHSWGMPNNVEVLNWMSGQTLTDPDPQVPQSLLTDRNAQVHYFQLRQRTPGQFSKLQYELNPAFNKLTLRDPLNLDLVSFSASRIGIAVAPSFVIKVDSGGPVGPDLIVTDVTTPQAVERFDGTLWIPVGFTNLPTAGILLERADNPPHNGVTALWRITP